MVESYFERVANEVLQASEEIVTRFEEGMNILMTGGAAPAASDTQSEGASADASEGEFDELYEEDDTMESPLNGIADSILGDIIKGQTRPQGFMDNIQAFRHAITWSEPFIMSLVAFHIIMFAFTIWVTRKNRGLAPRITLMLIIAICIKCSEMINRYGDEHWVTFATQNYFDRQGFFMLTMFSGPLLVNSLIMLVMFMKEAAQLLVAVKREELKRKKQTGKGRSKTDKKNQ